MKEREIRQECEALGLTVLEITARHHWRARLRNAHGIEQTITFPLRSTNLARSTLNRRAQLRRFANTTDVPTLAH